MIRSIVFDFDGTLVDSNELKRRAFFEVVAEHPDGASHMAAALATVGTGRNAIFQDYVERCTTPDLLPDANALTEAYSDRVDAAVAIVPEMPGASGLLADLKADGFRMYVNSATPRDSLVTIVRARGWMEYFHEVYGRPSTKVDALATIVAANGGESRRIAVIGDGVDDESAANAAGCEFIPVGCGSFATTRTGVHVLALSEIPARISVISSRTGRA